MYGAAPKYDERDRAIVASRTALLDEVPGPREGDYVRFADGTERRVSHVWPADWGSNTIQTSDGGSWYLGNGYCSFSGSLYTGVPPESLTLTDETRAGSVWIFHHDYACAGNGVPVSIPFRVYQCSHEATR